MNISKKTAYIVLLVGFFPSSKDEISYFTIYSNNTRLLINANIKKRQGRRL